VEQRAPAEEVAPSRRNVQTQRTSAAPAISEPATSAAPKPAIPQGPSTWNVSMRDVVDFLVKWGIPVNDDNKQLSLLMMQYGVELSEDNFGALFKLLKGNMTRASMESAVISLSKGLTDSSASVVALNQFVSKSPILDQQIQNLQRALADFQANITGLRTALNPSLFAGLSQVLEQFSDELKKFRRLTTSDNPTWADHRSALIEDVRTMGQFLKGIRHEYKNAGGLDLPGGQDVTNRLDKLTSHLDRLLADFTSQAILSKDDVHTRGDRDSYMYWTVANPMNPGNVDLLIKKDPGNRGAVDPEKTRVIIRLETPSLGEISVLLDIKEKRVTAQFLTEDEDVQQLVLGQNRAFMDALEQAAFQLTGFTAKVEKIDFKQLVLPTLHLDSMVRVSTEV
jgi:hypothetical protein